MKKSAVVGVLAAVLSVASGCTRSGQVIVVAGPQVPAVNGPVIDAGRIPPGETETIRLSNGAEIVVQNLGGTLYHEVEGTFAGESFERLRARVAAKPAAERNALLGRELARIRAKLRTAGAISLAELAEVGYFTFLLPYSPAVLSAVKPLRFDHSLLLNPVVVDRDSLRSVKANTPAAEGLVPRAGARGDTASFSGLERIGAPAFVRQAEADIGGGVRVDGSSVGLGITDTGITLNHPTFLSADGARNRVDYMRDFTREGRVYFSPDARLEVTDAGGEDLVLDAQVVVTPRLPAMPAGDRLADVKNLRIKASAELRAVLTTAGSGARLGVLLEDSLQAPGEPVDVNNNGKLDDKLFLILVPGAEPAKDRLFVDTSGTGDFRAARSIGDWNATGETVDSFAERIGFDLRADKLPKADGSDFVPVRSASIVGFDPGNHGSHVAGIAAGSRTIANDSDLTLARGVAPEARVLMNRVCANNGGCNATQAFIDLAVNAGAEVINMSLGGLSPFNDGYGVQETMINRLSSLRNVLFVISAGNSGPGRQTVGSPSVARHSLSVGATASRDLIRRQYQWPGDPGAGEADEDFMLFFSSRGPTAAGGFKPNVAAPGTELSAVQLNTAPGSRGGLDVYWGTSMAAPTAAGAYALLRDAVKKYNARNAGRELATDALVLRQVLIDSARPFGGYGWTDQGSGMIDLPAAWKKLFELRDAAVPSAIAHGGLPVELDYQVLVASPRNPNGLRYDGSRAAEGQPAFGAGVYLDFDGKETLVPVHVARRLPEALATGPDAGALTRLLLTTRDEFVLRTTTYGSDRTWVRAGTLDELGCAGSPEANLSVLGRGAEVSVKPDGSGEIVGSAASTLNLCVDREAIARDLAPGDHGALIAAHRIVDGKVSPVASFVVPVHVTVPHRRLAGSTGYAVERSVLSFGVDRNYVAVPEGTSVVRVTLEVPALKPGEACSGVELMALDGSNVSRPVKSRAEARISNCDANGAPVADARRRLTVTRTNPNPGVWDLHVFGSYKFARSTYVLKVDYVTANSSIREIRGGLAALTGSLTWTVKENSLGVAPDADRSSIEISALAATTEAKVAKDETAVVTGPLGALRAYPADAVSVTVTTGGSPGNDIDLTIVGCDASAATHEDPSCAPEGASGGATDEEKVVFKPKAGKVYAVLVNGYDIKDEGRFVSGEAIAFPAEKGSVRVFEAGDSATRIEYALTADQLAAGKLATCPLFTSGKYGLEGALVIRTADGTVLDSIPARIAQGTSDI